MKIVILEKLVMSDLQRAELEKLGTVDWHDSSTEAECESRIRGADVVVVDWVDPSPFILKMKAPSLLALMSTGYAWIQHRADAKSRGILISNIPGYATEAVAEHLIGLLLCAVKNIMIGDRSVRAGASQKGGPPGIELRGRSLGVIGLGRIGMRVAELARAFGMAVRTFNRTAKNIPDIPDMDLDTLLTISDVICVSCPLNAESKGMLDAARLAKLKSGAVLVGTTWDVIDTGAAADLLGTGRLRALAFDVAVEGANISLPERLRVLDNVVLTPHTAYNTLDAQVRQADICIENIRAFASGSPANIVN